MIGDWTRSINNFKSSEYNPSIWEPTIGAIFYVFAVIGLKKYYASLGDGPKPNVKFVAIVHNINLIILSILMATGGLVGVIERYFNEGYMGVFCPGAIRAKGTILDGAVGYWSKIFYWSKFYELVDTFLLCLKGNRTIPLHLYHHAVVLFVTWIACAYDIFEGLSVVILNSLVHVFMYTYYLLTVLGYKVWWKKHMTTLQIIQFLILFCYIVVCIYLSHTRADQCGEPIHLPIIWGLFAIDVSFIVLFSLFFLSTYKKDPKALEKKSEGKSD
jgi:fatty acid elongase 3